MSKFSSHAAHRSAQRSVRTHHIDFVLTWGRVIRQPLGRVAIHLGHREADDARRNGVTVPTRALNVAVIQAADGTIVTVIRSKNRRRLTRFARSGRSRRPQGGGR